MIQTLTVYRNRFSAYHIETTLKDEQGKVKAIFNSMLRQPKRGTKTIVINCWTYALNWDNVPKREGYIKVKDRVCAKNS
jgi:hypothetical protein